MENEFEMDDVDYIVYRGVAAGRRYAIFRAGPRRPRGNRYGIGFWVRWAGWYNSPKWFPFSSIAEAKAEAPKFASLY